MKYLTLMLCGMLACAATNAQTDSTYIDLGRMRARKEFTQTTVIKASDLAQMPFTNISDVIRLWVNGAYTDKSTIAYVIDGVMLNDADAYSIYDIEEITILQNALSQQNGAGNLQTLALITTRKDKGTKAHFSFAGQAFAVSAKTKSDTYSTEIFHQYSLRGSANIGAIAVGGSLNYLHDGNPAYEGDDQKVNTPLNLDRFRGNLWAQTNLGKKSRILWQGSYTPQVGSQDLMVFSNNNSTGIIQKFNEYLINTTLQLQTAFTNNLLNKFSAGYTANTQKGMDSSLFTLNYNGPGFSVVGEKSSSSWKSNVFYLNDNFNYVWEHGHWRIEPALNVNFQAAESEYNFEGSTLHLTSKPRFLTATPSIAISYKNRVNVHGGVMQDFSKLVQKDYGETSAFPFVTVAANVLPSDSKLSWKIYGSYAQTFAPNIASKMQLNDLPSYGQYTHGYPGYSGGVNENYGQYIPADGKKKNDRYQAGSDFSFFHKRITLGYNYLKAFSVTYLQLDYPGGTTIYAGGKYAMERHQVSLVGDLLQNNEVAWRTGFFVNFVENRLKDGAAVIVGQKAYTGGWTNRVTYKQFSAGADVLCLLNKQLFTSASSDTKYNSILLQNVYLGYTFNSKKLHNLNLYISSRNLADSNVMPLAPDNRRFYGGGMKFDF